MYIVNIFKDKKARMKTSLKRPRTWMQSVGNSAVSEHLDSLPALRPSQQRSPGPEGPLRSRLWTGSCQDANQQRLFAFPIFLWTKTWSVSRAQKKSTLGCYLLPQSSWRSISPSWHVGQHRRKASAGARSAPAGSAAFSSLLGVTACRQGQVWHGAAG